VFVVVVRFTALAGKESVVAESDVDVGRLVPGLASWSLSGEERLHPIVP
jgi:hypothetical protein